MSKELSLTGFILKSQDIGEQDVLLTFFSLEQGKVRVIVKSAKRLTSRLAGRIQPTTKLAITLAGNGSLPKLIGVTVLSSHATIIDSEEKIAALMVLQEYTNRALADGQINEELFADYNACLELLENNPADYSLKIATGFVVNTLVVIGLAPRRLEQIGTNKGIWLSFEEGRFVTESSFGQQSSVEPEVYQLYEQLSQQEEVDQKNLAVYKQLLRLINDFASYQLERQLRAAEYFFESTRDIIK